MRKTNLTNLFRAGNLAAITTLVGLASLLPVRTNAQGFEQKSKPKATTAKLDTIYESNVVNIKNVSSANKQLFVRVTNLYKNGDSFWYDKFEDQKSQQAWRQDRKGKKYFLVQSDLLKKHPNGTQTFTTDGRYDAYIKTMGAAFDPAELKGAVIDVAYDDVYTYINAAVPGKDNYVVLTNTKTGNIVFAKKFQAPKEQFMFSGDMGQPRALTVITTSAGQKDMSKTYRLNPNGTGFMDKNHSLGEYVPQAMHPQKTR